MLVEKVTQKALNRLLPASKEKNPQKPSGSSKSTKSSDKRPCWNCGSASHSTPECSGVPCSYCKFKRYSQAADDKHTFWTCPRKKPDRDRKAYDFDGAAYWAAQERH